MTSDKVLITGGAGFIGSTFVRKCIDAGKRVVILDALTYAGSTANVEGLLDEKKCKLIVGNILDAALIEETLLEFQPSLLVNFAAESHVDNSILGPETFAQTNVIGTFRLLESARSCLKKWSSSHSKTFRFVQVSTDEVFGSLGEKGLFSESSKYYPNSPYSASKAAADHFARAWFETYGVPTIITYCSNNYGPRQHPEKLIPKTILNALKGVPIPVYGSGLNIRDWIHVEDHCEGILKAAERGSPGETYCFGGQSERRNIDVVRAICKSLDKMQASQNGESYERLIQMVDDRLGHDFRYAINDQKARETIGFKRKYEQFESGLESTIRWYLENPAWLRKIKQ